MIPSLAHSAPFSLPFIARVMGLVIAVALGGCAKVGDLPFVYKLDVRQGNDIDEDMLARLTPGMEKSKVRFVLGTPLLVDTFHDERWDYVYSYARRGSDRVQRRVSLYFKNELLDHIEGDVEPSFGLKRPAKRREVTVKVPAIDRDEGFFAGLKPDFFKDDPVRVAKAEPAAQAAKEATEAGPKPEPEQAQAPEQTASATEGAAQSGTTTASATPKADPDATAIPLAEPGPSIPAAEERKILSAALSGFGRDPAPPAFGEDTTESASAEASSTGTEFTAGDTSAAAAEAEESSFFKGLVKRYEQWQKDDDASGKPLFTPRAPEVEPANER